MKFLWSMLIVLLLFVLACQDDPDIFPETKIIATRKSQFSGEWFVRSVIIDKQSHNAFQFVGLECPVERVKFQITEDKLFAYSGEDDRNQKLVAAFNIKQHFDQGHHTDRPWSEREYLKIDWSQNLVPHVECNGWLQSITMTNLSNNDVVDPAEPYLVRISDDYMETTLNAIVTPDQETCNSIGETNCAAANYRVKFSFRKLNNNNDYQKRNYPDYEYLKYGKNSHGYCLEGDDGCNNTSDLYLYSDAQRISKICDPLKDNLSSCAPVKIKLNSQFGFFRTTFDRYDRKNGFVRRDQQQLINRWNLWQHSIDANGQVIPLAERKPKKIIYYLNPGFPADLIPVVKKVAQHWNIAFLNLVSQIKNQLTIEKTRSLYGDLFEIRENSCNKKNVENYRDKYRLENVLFDYGISVINDDTVEKTCAVLAWAAKSQGLDDIFSWQQTGDLRYSFVNGVTKPEGAGLLGYGPSGVDPKTGEIISANANIYLAAITNYATKSVLIMNNIDKLRAKTGQIKEENIDRFNFLFDSHIKSVDNNFVRTSKTRYDLSGKIISIIDNINMPNLEQAVLSTNNNKKQAKDSFYGERSACFINSSYQLPYGRLSNYMKNMNMKERISYVKSQVVESVLLHEIGHTLGLRHNFLGAKDALNYPPDFWGVDTADFRMRHGLEKDELRSSSIMDYHKRFNSDFSGLGLYDYAALLSGYGEKIEVFDESSEKFIPKTMINNIDLMTYQDLPYLFGGDNADLKISRHAMQVRDAYRLGDSSAHMDIKSLALAAKPENFYKRRVIDYGDFKRQLFRNTLVSNPIAFVQVPYRFCTDGEAGGDDIFCQPFIYGSSASEIIGSAIEDYEMAHALSSLGISIMPSNVSSYLSFLYNRVYAPILRSYQHMYEHAHGEQKIYPAIYDLGVSTKRGLDLIGRVLQTVEPGVYCRDEAGDYVPKAESKSCEHEVIISNEIAKNFYSTFAEGLYANNKKVGFMYDKIMALLALVESNQVGFYQVFKPQMISLFSNIYTDQWQKLSPRLVIKDKQASIIYQDFFAGEAIKPNSGSRIKVSSSDTLKNYAILFSMAGLSHAYDHRLDFAARARISRFSSTNTGIDESVEKVVFKDPNTAISYRAYAPDGPDMAVGYQLLKDAQIFVNGPWQEAKARILEDESWFAEKNRELKAKVKVIEMVRGLSDNLLN